MTHAPISPLAAMRRRRPELFPDSEHSHESTIQLEVLDHHLDTLTKRKQEYQFEHFARLVAEQELCPNLRPQTGPTGGGDSKVDSETYPISSHISERWYAGDANAAQERWAFAFSAKEKWQPKVKADVLSIVGTDRGYSRIFFVTSRYAPDRKRAELEDLLSTTHGIPVTILDRTWLIEKVMRNVRSERALEALGITPPTRAVSRVGPNDAVRLRDLEDLDLKISDPSMYRTARYSLAEDMLNAALAARGLGRDRAEIDGRFLRASMTAGRVGVRDQQLRIAYLHAWTTFWWFEDRAAMSEMYDQVEALALTSDHAGDLQRLVSLWQLLVPQTANTAGADVDPRAERLIVRLNEMVADAGRPNNAFQAEVALSLMKLPAALRSGDEVVLDAIWTGLATIVERSAGQLNFSVETMFDLVQEVAAIVPDSDAYDDLMDRFVSVIERRRSESAAGEANLKRALHKLKRDKPYEAIRMLGKAELALAKDEHRELFVTTLVALAAAYQEAGLFWAARTKLLLAAEQCFILVRNDGDIPPGLVRVLQRLVWCEVQLGRLPQALMCWSHAQALAGQLQTDDDAEGEFVRDSMLQDAAIGLLLLKSDLSQLSGIKRLPDELGRLGLTLSRTAALWALGHDMKEPAGSETEGAWDPQAFFERLVEQPMASDLPCDPDLGSSDPVRMVSVVLGLLIVVSSGRTAMSIAVAEAILSAIEAFFSTSIDGQAMPWREEMTIRLAPSSDVTRFETVWTDTDSMLVATVSHPPAADFAGRGDRESFGIWLRDLIGEVIVRALVVPDPEAWLKRIAGDERGFSRAISLGNVPILSESLYGSEPRLSIAAWQSDEDSEYELRRDVPWRDDIPGRERGAGPVDGNESDGEYQTGRSRHSDLRISSIINMPLWNRADWSGLGSLVPDVGGPLILGLAFGKPSVGAEIFQSWRTRFGAADSQETIRVAIITGIDRRRPADYAVQISRSLVADERMNGGRYFVSFSRMLRINPQSSDNLDRFLEAFEREGAFLLGPMPMKSGPLVPADFRTDLTILKTELHVQPAWRIGPHDVDAIVIRPNDDPVIPADFEDAPILATLAAARSDRSGSFMQA